MTAPVGIGIIGTGTIAQVHLRSMAGAQQARPVAVYDVLSERATATAAEWQIPIVARSIDDLLSRPEVEAVIVCTPPFAHAEPTIQALQAGKHVLCEKPFTLDPQEAERMVAAAAAADRFLACASARNRLTQGSLRAHAMIEAGELGDVYHVRSTALRFRGRPGHHIFPQSAWFLDKQRAGGGAMMDIAVYTIDQVLWLLGNPRVLSVTAQLRQLTDEPMPAGLTQDVEDHVVIMLQAEGGKSGIIESAWVSNMDEADGLVVLGTRAGLKFDPLRKISAERVDVPISERRGLLGDFVYRPVIQKVLPFERPNLPGQSDVTNAFAASIAAGRQPMTPAQDALVVTQVIEAAYRSSAEQRAIAFSRV
jgi:predicted dehydrogenase